MSDAIRQLAEARRRRFESLSEAEKPKVAVCPDCGEPTYKREVCPHTGLFHDLDKKKLVGGSVVEGNIIKSSELMGAIDKTRVKWAASRTQLVKADAQSLNIFQSFASQLEWSLQRYGILYGRYDEESKTVEVHAVYEPEQHGNRYTFEMIDDKRIRVVDAIAKGLGLRRVGAVCTHPPRDPDVCLLSAREMLLCAREQSRFGDECVLLTVAPGVAGAASPTSNRDFPSSVSAASAPQAMVECQAWQTSPQCVYLYRLGLLHEPTEEERADMAGAAASASSGAAVAMGAASSPPLSGVGHASGRVGKPDVKVPVESSTVGGGASGGAAAAATSAPPPAMSVPEEARYVASTMALEVTQQDTDSNGKQRFVSKAPSKNIDTRWFTSYIAVQQFQSDVVQGLFMRISRPGMEPPTFRNLRNYFMDPKRRNSTFAEKIADFHVLIFLAEVFSNEDDMTVLTQIAKTKCMTEEAQNYEAIVNEYMKP